MSKPGKILNIGSSSLVDLKAELLRKKDELRKEKLKSNSNQIKSKPKEQKTTTWSKKNAGVLERAQRDLETKVEERNELDKSKSALESKAKLYEKMTAGTSVSDEDGSKTFLVDFQRKNIDTIVERRHNRLKEEEERRKAEEIREIEEERKYLSESVPVPQDPEEDWVEYVDEFGRSRRCMKRDLPRSAAKNPIEMLEQEKRSRDLLSSDMEREMMREKWEQEATEALKQDNLHYSNVQFDEKRAHGVGFYKFSKEEEERKAQIERLDEIRDKTKDQRQKRDEFKAKRKAKLAERLAKVKRRKLIREGKDLDEIQDEELSDEDILAPPEPSKPEPELLQRDDTLRMNLPEREWDKGKKKEKTKSTVTYIEERREEREHEFAPPSFYQDSTPKPRKAEVHIKQEETSETNTETADKISDNISAIRAEIKEEIPGFIDVKQEQESLNTESMHGDPNETDQYVDVTSEAYYDWYQHYWSWYQQYYPPTYYSQPTQGAYQPPVYNPSVPPPGFNPFVPPPGYNPSVPPPPMPTPLYNPSVPPPVVAQPLPPGTEDSTGQSQPTQVQPTPVSSIDVDEKDSSPQEITMDAPQNASPASLMPSPPVAVHPVVKPGKPTSSTPAEGAPQPAHYSSGFQPVSTKPRVQYQRVNLQDLPASLPPPPTAVGTPAYRSQEGRGAFRARPIKGPTAEDLMKNWQRQFNKPPSST